VTHVLAVQVLGVSVRLILRGSHLVCQPVAKLKDKQTASVNAFRGNTISHYYAENRRIPQMHKLAHNKSVSPTVASHYIDTAITRCDVVCCYY
jgi:hypothetical protein